MKRKKWVILVALALILTSCIVAYEVIANGPNMPSSQGMAIAQTEDTITQSTSNTPNNQGIGYITSSLELDKLTLDIENLNFIIEGERININTDHNLELEEVSLDLDQFSGKVMLQDSHIILEGSAKGISNNYLKLGALQNTKIIVSNGNLKSQKCRIPSMDLKVTGSLDLNNKEVIFNFKGEEIQLETFQGSFSLSSNPNMLSLSGSIKSLLSDNALYNLNRLRWS